MLYASTPESKGVFSLAAQPQLTKNSRQGSERKNRALAPSFPTLNSQTTQWGSWQSSGGTASGPTVYDYDGPSIVEEMDNTGSVLARYAQGLGIDQPLSEFRSGSASYYQADGLGSTTSLTDASGMIGATYAYDTVGNLLASTGSLANPFRYTSREFDSETGVYFYRARYFDQSAGRFLNEDPTYARGGLNFYAYVGNNPASLVDPSGLAPQWWNNLLNWLNPPAPPPVHWPTPSSPAIPLRCQYSAQCDFTPDMNTALENFQNCLGRRPTITCGRGEHGPNDPHTRGQAVDLGTNNNQWLTREQVRDCFLRWFPSTSYAEQEYDTGDSGPTQYHIQYTPGRGGATGFSPYIHGHGN